MNKLDSHAQTWIILKKITLVKQIEEVMQNIRFV